MAGSVPAPTTSKYLMCPLGVPCSQSFPLCPRRGAATAPPPLQVLFKFWLCEKGYEGSSFSPKDSVGSRMQQRMCQEPSDTSKPEKFGAWLISHSECLAWVVPCRNPAMTLVPGSPLQPGLPLTASFKAQQPICKRSHRAPGKTSRNQEGVSALLRHPHSQPTHQCKDYPGFFNSCCSVNFSTRLGAQHCGLTLRHFIYK